MYVLSRGLGAALGGRVVHGVSLALVGRVVPVARVYGCGGWGGSSRRGFVIALCEGRGGGVRWS